MLAQILGWLQFTLKIFIQKQKLLLSSQKFQIVGFCKKILNHMMISIWYHKHYFMNMDFL